MCGVIGTLSRKAEARVSLKSRSCDFKSRLHRKLRSLHCFQTSDQIIDTHPQVLSRQPLPDFYLSATGHSCGSTQLRKQKAGLVHTSSLSGPDVSALFIASVCLFSSLRWGGVGRTESVSMTTQISTLNLENSQPVTQSHRC